MPAVSVRLVAETREELGAAIAALESVGAQFSGSGRVGRKGDWLVYGTFPVPPRITVLEVRPALPQERSGS